MLYTHIGNSLKESNNIKNIRDIDIKKLNENNNDNKVTIELDVYIDGYYNDEEDVIQALRDGGLPKSVDIKVIELIGPGGGNPLVQFTGNFKEIKKWLNKNDVDEDMYDIIEESDNREETIRKVESLINALGQLEDDLQKSQDIEMFTIDDIKAAIDDSFIEEDAKEAANEAIENYDGIGGYFDQIDSDDFDEYADTFTSAVSEVTDAVCNYYGLDFQTDLFQIKDSENLNEARNPENDKINEIITKSLNDVNYAKRHEKDLNDAGIDLKITDKAKSNYSWDNNDFGINLIDRKTGKALSSISDKNKDRLKSNYYGEDKKIDRNNIYAHPVELYTNGSGNQEITRVGDYDNNDSEAREGKHAYKLSRDTVSKYINRNRSWGVSDKEIDDAKEIARKRLVGVDRKLARELKKNNNDINEVDYETRANYDRMHGRLKLNKQTVHSGRINDDADLRNYLATPSKSDEDRRYENREEFNNTPISNRLTKLKTAKAAQRNAENKFNKLDAEKEYYDAKAKLDRADRIRRAYDKNSYTGTVPTQKDIENSIKRADEDYKKDVERYNSYYTSKEDYDKAKKNLDAANKSAEATLKPIRKYIDKAKSKLEKK